MYSIFTKLGDGEFLLIASDDELEQVVKLLEKLNDIWPHEYVVRDLSGNDVNLTDFGHNSVA